MRVLLLEPFAGPPFRQLFRTDPAYAALGLHAIRRVMDHTGPMRLQSMVSPPLGLAQLAAVLRRSGYTVVHDPVILDARRGPPSDAALARRLSRLDFDAVCLSVGDPESASEALRYVRVLAAAAPGRPVIVGGSQPTFDPSPFAGVPGIAALVRGPGDAVLVPILDALLAGSPLPVLAGVAGGGRVPDDLAPRVAPEALPPMDFEAVLAPRYLRASQLANVQASYGCPYGCPFCLHHVLWGSRPTPRPIGHLLEELDTLDRHGARFVYFIDSTFTGDRDHALRVAAALAARRFRMRFCCETRADHVDPELIDALARAGFVLLWIGAESGAPEVLARLHGKSRGEGRDYLERMREAVRLARRGNILVGSSWIVGLPGETPATVHETQRFIEELIDLGMDSVDIRSLVLLPGTSYQSEPARFGLAVVEGATGTQRFQAERVAAGTEAMTAEQIHAARLQLQRAAARRYRATGIGLLSNLARTLARDRIARLPGFVYNKN